jgi:acyl-CoA thioesterase-1
MKNVLTTVLAFVALVSSATAADPKPRVLLLGDSISKGYHSFVVEALKEEAFVTRPKQNCAGTNFGVTMIDGWLELEGGDWDVIHFNWGLHDLKRVGPDGKNSDDPKMGRQAEIDVYEKQLTELVTKITATGAKCIFATTTPYPKGVSPWRDPEDAARYNKAALKIMKEYGVAIDDLYFFCLPRLEELQRPRNVHFGPEGSEALAGEVVKSIRAALGE